MPIYKCPEGDYQSVFDENQRKISEFHQKENGISANQNKPQKRYAFLKTLEHSVKYLFRNFFKILFIMLGYKSGSKTYILFVLFGGVGDLIREKSIVCELIKMSPRVVIDLVWKKKKAYPFFCEIKNIRFYLYLTQPLFRLIKKRYDIVYTCQHDKPEMVKIEFINENKKLAAYIKENIKKYETVKSANSNHFICSYKKAAGVDNIYDKTLTIYYKRQSLKKFGIFDDDKYITFQTGIAEAGYQPRLGRSWNIKNYLAMLDILKTKIDKSVKFVLVGNGNLSAVREAIKEKQLKINARFGGAANAPPEIFEWEGGGAIAL